MKIRMFYLYIVPSERGGEKKNGERKRKSKSLFIYKKDLFYIVFVL